MRVGAWIACLAVVLLSLAGTGASGQAYPEYDGVYLKLDDGTFVQLPLHKGNGSRSVQFHLDNMHTNAIGQKFFGYEDLEPFPVVDIKRVTEIVVVGVAPREFVLFPVAEARDLFKDYVGNPRATATYSQNKKRVEIAAADLPAIFASQTCGTGGEFLRIKRVNAFVTEFSVRPEFRQKDGSVWNGTAMAFSGGKCVSLGHPAVAMEILIDRRYFASFRTKQGVADYLARAGVASPSPPKSQGTIVGAYNSSGDCQAAEDSEGHLKVTPETFEFYESTCRIDRLQPQSDGSQAIDLSCAGEGQEWKRSIKTSLDAAGNLTITEGADAWHFQACR